MTNNRRALLYLSMLFVSMFSSTISGTPNCPVEGTDNETCAFSQISKRYFIFLADPASILSCVAIDAVGLVQATKGNLRVFCTMAERFMECVKTKTRGCLGEEVRIRINVVCNDKLILRILVCTRIFNRIN